MLDLVAQADMSIPSVWSSETERMLRCLSGFSLIWWLDVEMSGLGTISTVEAPSTLFVARFIQRFDAVWDHIWKHRARLIFASQNGPDNFRTYGGTAMLQETGRYLVFAARKRLADSPAPVKSSKLPAFLLWSWWLIPPESGHQSDNRVLDAFIQVYMSSAIPQRRVWMEDVVLKDIGAEKVLSKLIRSITENEIIAGDLLGNTLLALDEIASWKHPDMAQAAGRVPITSTLAFALQNRDGSARPYIVDDRQPGMTHTHVRFKIWISCAHLLEAVASGLASGTTKAEMVSGIDVYNIFAHGLTLALAALLINEKEAYEAYSGFYTSSLQCWTNHLRQHKRDKHAFPTAVVQSLRHAAGPAWYGILLELRRLTDVPVSIKHLIEDWLAFGVAIGFDEEKKRKEHNNMLAHICSWPFCPYHLSPAEEAFKHCKGCGVAHYCSPECQASDWKKGGHKAACRRLKT
ncbi:unnamed protein product [Peniophora sp. CBMAI 1063]|nr:unnamed protein product [Peniophora sp. CBMAI 1063]